MAAWGDKNIDAGGKLLLDKEPRLAGYGFAGWNDKPDGSGTAYRVGDYVEITEIGQVVTLYAQWRKSGYLIAFNPNGGELESGEAIYNQIAYFGIGTRLDTPAMTLPSCYLAGWNTDSDGTGNPYAIGEDVIDIATAGQETVYLYAQWAADTYTVNYDGNGGEGAMRSDTFECGIAHSLPNRGFSREGYNFVGWNTVADGSGVAFDSVGAYSDLAIAGERVTLYAQWQQDEPEPGPSPDPGPEPSPDPDDPSSGDDGPAADSSSQSSDDSCSALAGTGDASIGVQIALVVLALASAIAALALARGRIR